MERLFLFFFIIIGCGVNAQKTPFFLTTFYFKDAIGNLDSIEIGFDRNANNYSNPDFGEITDLSPFNNVFDVRAVNYFEYYNTTPPIRSLNLLSDRIVGNMDTIVNDHCYGTPFLIFFIHAKYQPITISVKRVSEFQKIDCPGHNTWNFFSPDRGYHFIEPWQWAAMPEVRYGCLKDSIYSLYLDNSHRPLFEKPYLLKYEVEGNGIDSIFGVCFSRDQSFYQCDSTYVILENPILINDFLLYPNPLFSFIKIQIDGFNQPINYEIFSQTGRVIKKNLWPRGQDESILDLVDLQTGAYYLKLNYKVGSKVKIFIKT